MLDIDLLRYDYDKPFLKIIEGIIYEDGFWIKENKQMFVENKYGKLITNNKEIWDVLYNIYQFNYPSAITFFRKIMKKYYNA